MSKAPELLESTGQMPPPKPAGDDRGGPGEERLDVGLEHARALLEACRVSPDRLPTARTGASHAAIEWAASGAMALTGPADGAPRFAAGPLASAARGAALAFEVLAGAGSRPALDGPGLLGERAAIFGLSRQGSRSAGGSARLLPARDGTLALNLPREDDWHLVPAWLEDEAVVMRGATTSTSAGERADDWQRIARQIATRAVAPLVERGRLIGLALAPAPRGPRAEATTEPAFFALHAESQAPPRAEGRAIRLLDLSTLWAGPLATSLLADLGIDVLKIESPNRPDGARNGPKAFFDLMNGNKHGAALDLRDAHDRALFERLLDSADVVVESARPRALSQLGYDAHAWVSEQPGRLWTSITGYGRSQAGVAFGDDAAIAAGLAWSPRPDETDPCFCADAIADPLAGLHVAVFVLAHLQTGCGGLLDVSLAEIARRAACATHSGVTLPIERENERFFVLDGAHRQPVESPRSRPIQRAAPRLVAPSDRCLADWTRASC